MGSWSAEREVRGGGGAGSSGVQGPGPLQKVGAKGAVLPAKTASPKEKWFVGASQECPTQENLFQWKRG